MPEELTITKTERNLARMVNILLDGTHYLSDTVEVLYAELNNPSQYAKDKIKNARKFVELIKKLEDRAGK